MNIDLLREAFAPWIDVVIRDFSKNFLFDYGIDTLAFLHEKIDAEIESVYSARIKDRNNIISKSEALFTALTYLYNHFCWKMSHQKESPNVKKSCVKLLSQLTKTGLILSKGVPKSEWINRILTAIRLFTGEPELIYEAVLLVSCLKPKYHRAYVIILKHVLINEDQECITNPLVYMEVILLFRRLKGLLKKKYSRACAITLAARIKPPCNLISWLMSLDVEGVNGLKYKTLAKQLMGNKVPETLLKKVRDIALSCYVFRSDNKREKYQEASDEPSDLFVIDASSINDSHSMHQNQKLLSNACVSSESNHKTVSVTLSSKKKKKQLIISHEKTEDEYVKSKTSTAREAVVPMSYINDYSNLIAERDHEESANESEDYYMASQSDSSVNALSLKNTPSKSNISAKSSKKKQKSNISYRNLTPTNKEQKIEIIEISCSDNKPCVDLTDANKIPKPSKDLQSNSKRKMIENEKCHSSFVDQSNSNNTNSQLQVLKNSKPSESLICKMPSKQNANKTIRLTENTKELSTEGLDPHMVPASSTESVADSFISVNLEQNANVSSSLHAKMGMSDAKKISEDVANKIISISSFPKKSSLPAVSETKILLESNSQSMEVDVEAAVKDVLSAENKISSSVFSKECQIISDNVQNDDNTCKDFDNHLLHTKCPSKETNISKIDVENSYNLGGKSADLEIKQSGSSSNCTNPNEIPIGNSIDNILKLSVSNSNSSEGASENSYNSFVRRSIQNRQLDISIPSNISIDANLNCTQNELLKSSEKSMTLEEESIEYVATDENTKLESEYSQISNVQLLKSAPEDKICEESHLSTPSCSEFSLVSVNDCPKTSNCILSSEKRQLKRKLSDISNSDDGSLPVNYDSIETESNKSEKLIQSKKECTQNVSLVENIQLQVKCIKTSDGQGAISSKDLASNKISEVNFSSETQDLVADFSQEISEDVSSFEKLHKKLSNISDTEDISSQKPCESMEIDSLKVSQKSDQAEQNSPQTQTSNDSMKLGSKYFRISDTHANTSPQNGNRHDVFQEINVSSENSSKCSSTVLSCNFSQENSENISPKVPRHEHEISDVTNSDYVLPSQNSNDLVEADSKEVKSSSGDSVKNISSSESIGFQVRSPISDSPPKIVDPCKIFEEKNVPSASSLQFDNTCSLNANISQDVSTDVFIQGSHGSVESDSVKLMHLDEISVEGKLSDENIELKFSQESSSLCNTSSGNADCSSPHLSVGTKEENSANVSCSFEKKNLKNKPSDISDSNETPLLENCDLVGDDSFRDSDKVTQTGEVLVRNESVMTESKSTASNICNSTLKNADEDTMSEKLSLTPECIAECSSSVISANIALETTEIVPVIERHQQEKLDVSDSDVKPVGENYNADKFELSSINSSGAEGSSHLTQNNQCEQYEIEIKIKTNTLANSQNVADEPVENSSPTKGSDNLDNFKTAYSSTSVQSAEVEIADRLLLPGNTGITPENIKTELKTPVNSITEIISDEINKGNSTFDHASSKVHDIKSETAAENASPKRQSQPSKFILSSSDEVKFSGNNSDIIDSSSVVTDSESKFSSKYSSSESIDILHISDEGENCKEINDAKDSNIQNLCKEALQKTSENKTKTLKEVELAQMSKISNESSVLKEISKNSSYENFPDTCESKNYLSFSDLSLLSTHIVESSESANKLKNFSFAASTEIFSSYRNDLLSEEDKTSVLSCGPELKDCVSCKSNDEKSKLSSEGSDGECYSDHSNSEVESNQMIDKVEIAPIENSSTEVALKTDYDIKTEESSRQEISEKANESSCNEKNSAAIGTDLQSKNEYFEDHTLNEASNQKTESIPRHSLRLRNKTKIENETQCDSSENASHEERDFSNKEIDDGSKKATEKDDGPKKATEKDDGSKKATEKDDSVCDNEKDLSSINSDKVPQSPESIICKTPSARHESESKSKSKEDKIRSSFRRYSLRQKCKKIDDSSKLGIDLSQLHLGSPSRRKPTKDNSIIAELLPLDSDPSEKVDDESDLTFKRETRSSVAKVLKEETVLNTPSSYNLRTRKSIIAPGKLKL